MKKSILFIFIFLLSGCSVTMVYVEKKVYINDGKNSVEITGSDLEGNTANQSADGKISLPIP